MTDRAPPLLFSADRIVRNRERAAARFDQYAFLKSRLSSHLAERLADVSRQFPAALDLMTHNGQAGTALLASGQVDDVSGLEPSSAFAAQCNDYGNVHIGPLETLPFEGGRFDLVTSILGLHWANDLPGVLMQIRNVLKPDGLFLGALFGAGTLSELRASLIAAESELYGGASVRISPLPGLQDMAGLMQRAGFALPVADIDRLTVRYDSALDLMRDLKGMGEQAAFAPREGVSSRPMSRRLIAQTCAQYQDQFSDPDGRIRASFEIVWLSGWAPAEGQPQPLKPGSGKFSLEQAIKGSAGTGS